MESGDKKTLEGENEDELIQLQEDMDTLDSRLNFERFWSECSPKENTIQSMLSPDWGAFFKAFKKNNFKTVLAAFKKKCANNRIKFRNKIKCDTYTQYWGSSSKLNDKIKSYWNKNKKYPIGISYCANLLDSDDKDYRGFRKIKSFMKDSCGLHESLLMGKRVCDGVLQYYIRNSWDPKDDSGPNVEKTAKGDVWINAKALMRNTDELSFVREEEN